jgi:hypothetical protein
MIDLMKYVIAGAVSIVLAVTAGIFGNVLTGVLIFVLVFGGYIMLNIVNDLKPSEPKQVNITNVDQKNHSDEATRTISSAG